MATAPHPHDARFDLFVVAGLASTGAGLIHAGTVGVHLEHVQLARLFVVLASLQVACGVWVVLRRSRWGAVVTVLVNAAAVGGWQTTRVVGITWVDGLGDAESPQFADTVCAVLGAIAIGAVLVARLRTSRQLHAPWGALSALVVAALVVSAMWTGSAHLHDADEHSHEGTVTLVGGGPSAAAVGRPYDPTQPIDLSGFEGVTPEQQAAAENLVAITVVRLPQWADAAVAEAAGFRSIGDAITGHEHFVNWAWIDDDTWLDPDHPESLVYEPQPDGSRRLVSAMYMLPPSMSLEQVPDIGGELMQWHVHDNLCFTANSEAPRVARVTSSGGPCPDGTEQFPRSPMIHVWIIPQECGPFAALEGIGAGQIAAGEERLCDHLHGSG